MNIVDFVLSILAVFTQLYVVYVGWKLLRVAKFLDTWRMGWYHFVGASILITILRIIWSYEAYTSTPAYPYVESVFALLVSACLLWFVYYMRMVFQNTIKETVASFEAEHLVDVAREVAKKLIETAENVAEEKIKYEENKRKK
jgi:hypothetical protein